jgi:hypothetical protein
MLNIRLDRTPASRQARTLVVAALLALTVPLAGFAQATYYSVSGSVLDPTNRVLPGATLVLSNADRQSRHEVKSDAVGHFEFVGLPAGEYAFEARQMGFANFRTITVVLEPNGRCRSGLSRKRSAWPAGSARRRRHRPHAAPRRRHQSPLPRSAWPGPSAPSAARFGPQ